MKRVTHEPPIWIVGTGGHAVVIAALARACGWTIAGCVHPEDDTATGSISLGSQRAATVRERSSRGPGIQDHSLTVAARQASHCSIPILGSLSKIPRGAPVAIAIGDNARREALFDQIVRTIPGVHFPTLIHPLAKVEQGASIADGSCICIGAIVCAGVSLGRGVLVNSGAIVEHECVIEPFAHLCPGVKLAGRVRVGLRAMVGLAATVIQGLSIGSDAVVGGGAVVLDDVPPNSTAVGVPARILARVSD